MTTYLVRGSVTSSDGGPLAGAELTLSRPDGRRVTRARTDVNGRYELRSVESGPHVVMCTRPQSPPHAAVVALGETPAELDLVIPATGTLTGLVIAGGRPTSDAIVSVINDAAYVLDSAITDFAGRYRFRDLPAGTYTITAHASGVQPTASTVAVPASQYVECDLELVGSRALGGVVRNPDGTPVPGAILTVVAADGTVVASAIADADGGYALENVPSGKYSLRAAVRCETTTSVHVPPTCTLDPVIRRPAPASVPAVEPREPVEPGSRRGLKPAAAIGPWSSRRAGSPSV